MSQTPLKVIGLDHHCAFYSVSWGCLGQPFLWENSPVWKDSFDSAQETETAEPWDRCISSSCCLFSLLCIPFALKRCKPNLIEIGRDFRSWAICDRCNTYQPDVVLGDLPAFPSLLLWGFSETHCNVLSHSVHCKKSHTRVFNQW